MMDRDEYTIRAREFCKRGMDLPQSKLTPIEVDAIRSAARQRENLRKHIRENLSNEALAREFGVHYRTIEKVLQGVSWVHV
jgi:predicted DNA-binding transcriptional regulator YafY